MPPKLVACERAALAALADIVSAADSLADLHAAAANDAFGHLAICNAQLLHAGVVAAALHALHAINKESDLAMTETPPSAHLQMFFCSMFYHAHSYKAGHIYFTRHLLR